jgi:type IV secretion system protein VirB2
MNKFVKNIRNYLPKMNYKQLALTFLAITFASVEPSFAQDFGSITTVFQTIVTAVTGPIGIAVATLGIIGVGVTFLSGRMDWMFALSIIVGIAFIFGAATIAASF